MAGERFLEGKIRHAVRNIVIDPIEGAIRNLQDAVSTDASSIQDEVQIGKEFHQGASELERQSHED